MKWIDRLNSAIDRIARIPSDKWAHGVVSMVMVIVIGRLSTLDVPANIFVAFCVTMGAGLTKEMYDEVFRHGFDWDDLIADMVGCVVGMIIFLL